MYSLAYADRPVQADQAPPAGKTGAQRTLPERNRILIDWLSFTLHGMTVDRVCKLLHLDGWVELERGGLGYRRARQSGSCKVYYDGTPEMGVHVVLSGTACRELENLGIVRDWRYYLRDLLLLGAKITRLDVAFDDVEGYLSIDDMSEYWRRGWVVTRWRSAQNIEQMQKAGQVSGRTLYFGRRVSGAYLRAYDKALEQGIEGHHWVRLEMELKGDRAMAAASAIVEHGISYLSGVLRSYIDFVVPTSSDSNRRRWEQAPWWAAFLGWVQKARLAVAPVERTVEKLHAWLRRQVAPSLATLLLAAGGDFAVISDLLNDGRSRLSTLHWLMIKQAQTA